MRRISGVFAAAGRIELVGTHKPYRHRFASCHYPSKRALHRWTLILIPGGCRYQIPSLRSVLDNMKKLLVLPGDHIGVEVIDQTLRVVDWLRTHADLEVDVTTDIIGGASWDRHGTFVTDTVVEKCRVADAILFGAEGGPKWDEIKARGGPKMLSGLRQLRKDLDLFANLRPVKPFDALDDASSLKPEVVRGVDLVVVRELTSGIYYGQPRGIETRDDGSRRGIDTQSYTDAEIERIVRFGFELAMSRRKHLTSVDKANVLRSSVLWRDVVTEVAPDFPQVTLNHLYVDNATMQLVRDPKQFDVIVTDNLFGDILSDGAAMITGSLGMLPSASLGPVDSSGHRPALFEPVHGSAPDIAGQGIANPIAAMLSLAMALRLALERPDLADRVESAIAGALNTGLRTADIAADPSKATSTTEMADAVLAKLALTS